jgi:glycosyltransferase involved in cell wall biosynthesis
VTADRPRRILYVSPNGRRGGAESVLALTLRHHDRRRFHAEVFFLRDGPFVEELSRERVACHVGPPARLRQPWNVARATWAIRQRILEGGFDLVHSLMGYGHLFGGVAARAAGVPEVWFQHGPVGALDALAARVPTDALLVNSRHTERAQARLRPSARATLLIHPGCEPLLAQGGSLEREAQAVRARYGLGPGTVVFGLAGRLSPMKGQRVLLDAVAELRKRRLEVAVLVIGGAFMPADDEYARGLRERARELGLEGVVRFTGHLNPPYPAMQACDAIVVSSVVPEPFCLAMVEGMMLAKPVIVPAAGGPLEVVTEGEDGLLFPSGDPLALADRMEQVIGMGAEARRALGGRALRSAQSRFSAEKMTRDLEAAYERVLQG